MEASNTTEERKKRFQKLASARTKKILRGLDILANCSNKSNYVYEETQVNKIFEAIRKKVDEVEMRFKVKKGSDFEL